MRKSSEAGLALTCHPPRISRSRTKGRQPAAPAASTRTRVFTTSFASASPGGAGAAAAALAPGWPSRPAAACCAAAALWPPWNTNTASARLRIPARNPSRTDPHARLPHLLRQRLARWRRSGRRGARARLAIATGSRLLRRRRALAAVEHEDRVRESGHRGGKRLHLVGERPERRRGACPSTQPQEIERRDGVAGGDRAVGRGAALEQEVRFRFAVVVAAARGAQT